MNIKKSVKEHKLLFLFIFCILTFAHFGTRVIFGWRIYLDEIVGNILPITADSSAVRFWVSLTNLGSKDFIVIFIVVMVIYFVYSLKDRSAAMIFPFVVFGSHELNKLIKQLIVRERPEINTIVFESGYSFPSGHSMTGLVCYGFVCYVLYKNLKNATARMVVVTFFSVLIVLIGVTRIILGAHYFSDVISGFSLGGIYLIIAVVLYDKLKAKYPNVWPIFQKESA